MTNCSGISSGDTQSTSTAQAERAIRMATDIAEDLQATAGVIYQQALATADARHNLFEQAKQWPLVFGETFDENIYDWAEGSESDPLYATIQWSFRDGKYLWEAKAYDGFIWWVRPDMGKYSDFLITVTAKQLNYTEDGEYGIIFRQTDGEDYYLFELDGVGNYAFYIHYEGEWESLLDWKYSPEIVNREENRLAVLAQGDEFQFYVNDAYIDSYRDDRLETGRAGLLIGLSNPEEEGTWEFDDFEIRSLGKSIETDTPSP